MAGDHYEFSFRDLRGDDLEFYECFFVEGNSMSFSDQLCALQRICNVKLRNAPAKWIGLFYSFAAEHIFCHYMDKYTWLQACHAMQNGKFVSLELESQPLSKFINMCEIQREYVSKISKD